MNWTIGEAKRSNGSTVYEITRERVDGFGMLDAIVEVGGRIAVTSGHRDEVGRSAEVYLTRADAERALQRAISQGL